MKRTKSSALFGRAKQLMPGGVNSPVRAFKAVGGDPLVIDHAAGPCMTDVDGNEFIDYVLSWGPLILGHAHPGVLEAIHRAAVKGTSFGAPNRYEVELAELTQQFFPSLELVRFVNSGTEATMSAIRLARAYTGRERIAKFVGCYHGHVDSLLVKGGSGLLTLGIPATPGVPKALAKLTSTLPFNDEAALRKLFAKEGGKLAAIIIEPVVGNSGVVIPTRAYMQLMRKLCTQHGVVLIYDEVMTGFRVARGGAQEYFGVKPDLTTFGKVIGGGLPVGAYGGRKDIMKNVAPSGDVYQAGTLSGNPLAMAAGIATLRALQADKKAFVKLEAAAHTLSDGLRRLAAAAGIPVTVNQVGSMFTMFFTAEPVTSPEAAMRADAKRYAKFFQAMLEEGVYLPPSQYEAAFVSTAHTPEIIEETLEAAEAAFAVLRKAR
jgi:glutamate-1-semialdehyde 2,1-aminomutase